jgi:hypothetical protein
MHYLHFDPFHEYGNQSFIHIYNFFGSIRFAESNHLPRIIIKFTSFVSTDYRINVVFVYTILFFGADCISLKFIYKFYLFKKMLVGNKKIQILIEQETTLIFLLFSALFCFSNQNGPQQLLLCSKKLNIDLNKTFFSQFIFYE